MRNCRIPDGREATPPNANTTGPSGCIGLASQKPYTLNGIEPELRSLSLGHPQAGDSAQEGLSLPICKWTVLPKYF